MYLFILFIVVVFFYLNNRKEGFFSMKMNLINSLKNIRDKIKKDNDKKKIVRKELEQKERKKIEHEKNRLKKESEQKERTKISSEEIQGILTSYLYLDL